jgi:hypothetical protein
METSMEKAVSKTRKSSIRKEENLRYERKYIFSSPYLEDLVQQLFSNSFGFKEIYEIRSVNNVYFDDHNYNFYKQNVSGVGKREKYRLRWYGDNFSRIESPSIEIKKKFGEVGDKVIHKLENFVLDINSVNAYNLIEIITDKIDDNLFLKNRLQELQPTLFNSYERRYFLSDCKKFRITLDFHQKFYNPYYANYMSSERRIEDDIVVLELKYNLVDDTEARLISQEFESRVSRNSKYVQGIDLIMGLGF